MKSIFKKLNRRPIVVGAIGFVGSFTTLLFFQNCGDISKFSSSAATARLQTLSAPNGTSASGSTTTTPTIPPTGTSTNGGSGSGSTGAQVPMPPITPNTPPSTPPAVSPTPPTQPNPVPTPPVVASPVVAPPVTSCTDELAGLGWGESHPVTLDASASGYENYLVGVNQKVLRRAGFDIEFCSSSFNQTWRAESLSELPAGLSLRMTDLATGHEIPISQNDYMGSAQYPSQQYRSYYARASKTASYVCRSSVSIGLRNSFFVLQKLGYKNVKIELVCASKVYGSGQLDMKAQSFTNDMLDYYRLDENGYASLYDLNRTPTNYSLVDRSIEGASLILNCSAKVKVKVGQSVTCTIQRDLIVTSQWSISSVIKPEYDNKETITLTNLPIGRYVIKGNGSSTGGNAVESNIVKVEVIK